MNDMSHISELNLYIAFATAADLDEKHKTELSVYELNYET